MSTKSINHTIADFLRKLTDNNSITIQQNKHIKLIGTYNGKQRSFTLSSSPSQNYQKSIKSALKKFVRSLDRSDIQDMCQLLF